MSRFQLIIEADHDVDVHELFPNPADPDDPTLDDVDQTLEGADWRTVLGEWNYADGMTMRLIDSVSGAVWEYDGFNSWRREVSS